MKLNLLMMKVASYLKDLMMICCESVEISKLSELMFSVMPLEDSETSQMIHCDVKLLKTPAALSEHFLL